VGPALSEGRRGQRHHQASYFTACNRNKRSVTIDMATPEGQALIKQMALQADIVVENFKVGGLKQYGLDHESLRALNPRLIYCSVTGFGQDGPYAERAGYDLMVQAMTGMMSITGRADNRARRRPAARGRGGDRPVHRHVRQQRHSGGAARARQRTTGQGQHIDMALLDVGMAVLANQASGFLATGQAPGRMGNSHPSLAPYQDFPTQDGNMLLAIGNDGQFQRFCAAAGQPQWASDPRFATNTLRVQHRSRTDPRHGGRDPHAHHGRHGLRCWKTRPCPAAPSTPLPRRLTTPRSRRAAWPWSCRAGRMATAMASHDHRRGQPAAPVGQSARAAQRPAPRWASTPMRCCASWGWMPTASHWRTGRHGNRVIAEASPAALGARCRSALPPL
jgi:hypothetical protein